MPPKKRNANTGKKPPENKVITTDDNQKMGQRKGRASVNKVTPDAKKPKTSKNRYVVFTLDNGRRKGFDDEVDASEFRMEFGPVISSETTFTCPEKMQAYVSNASASEAKSSMTAVNLSPEDKKKRSKALKTLQDKKGSCVWNFYVKTTKSSAVAIVVLYPTIYERYVWYVKKPIDEAWKQFFRNFTTGFPEVDEFWTNLTSVVERDPEKGNNDAKVNVRKDDGREFKQNIFYTWFTIPWQKLKSREDEDEFIKGTAEEAVSQMRLALKNSVFLECIETVFTEKMFKAMTNEQGYGFTLQKFIETCRVSVSRMDNLNKYVVLDDSKAIQMFLFEKELPHKKYEFDTEAERKNKIPKNKETTQTQAKIGGNDSYQIEDDDDTTSSEDEIDNTQESNDNRDTNVVKIKIEPGLDTYTEKINKKDTQDALEELKNAAYCNDNSDDDIVDQTDTDDEEE